MRGAGLVRGTPRPLGEQGPQPGGVRARDCSACAAQGGWNISALDVLMLPGFFRCGRGGCMLDGRHVDMRGNERLAQRRS